MLTIFTAPKPFSDKKIAMSQENAILSWKKSFPNCEIILFGDEDGIAEFSRKFNLLHVPEVKRNEFGTPYIGDIFNQAKNLAKNNLLLYSNSDIIFLENPESLVGGIDFPLFLIGGRRLDLEVKESLNFSDDWKKPLREKAEGKGVLHGFCGMDYFIFPKSLPMNFPLLAIGRPGWDSWFVGYIRSQRIPLIDATGVIHIIHQNHDHSHVSKGEEGFWFGEEAKKNIESAGDFLNFMTLREADFILTEKGLEPPGFLRIIFSKLMLFYPWKKLLQIKRKIDFKNKKI